MILLKDIMIGIISGILSGFVVYLITKRREEKRTAYSYWLNFLLGVMKECEIYIPSEQLEKISIVGGKGTKWHDAVFSILDEMNPFELKDRELDERETRIAENMVVALSELSEWKKKNHL